MNCVRVRLSASGRSLSNSGILRISLLLVLFSPFFSGNGIGLNCFSHTTIKVCVSRLIRICLFSPFHRLGVFVASFSRFVGVNSLGRLVVGIDAVIQPDIDRVPIPCHYDSPLSAVLS